MTYSVWNLRIEKTEKKECPDNIENILMNQISLLYLLADILKYFKYTGVEDERWSYG